MKRAAIVLSAVAGIAGALRAQSAYTSRAWFPDGTGLEIYSESTGSTQASPGGSIGIGPQAGAGSRDVVNRCVLDNGQNILFAYDVEASQGAAPGTVVIRVEPITPEWEVSTRKWQASKVSKLPGGHIPTIAAAHEFKSVRIGDAVTLDILYNPSTGEKIYDVIRPITDPAPAPPANRPVVTGGKSRPEISLRDVAAKVNGHVVQVPASWVIGTAVRIDVPGHGAYFAALYDQKDAPPILYAFKQIAHADGKKLVWSIDGDKVEIDSTTNVLTQSLSNVLWLYHDARVKSPDVKLQAADSVDALMSRK